MSTTTTIGRWSVRVAFDPDPLWDGMEHNWTRARRDYERGTIVEIYDNRYTEGFSTLGQFVSAYGAETLYTLTGGLSLDGGIPEWTMAADEVRTMLQFVSDAEAAQGWGKYPAPVDNTPITSRLEREMQKQGPVRVVEDVEPGTAEWTEPEIALGYAPSTTDSTDTIVRWMEQQPGAEEYLGWINQGTPASEALGAFLADRKQQ